MCEEYIDMTVHFFDDMGSSGRSCSLHSEYLFSLKISSEMNVNDAISPNSMITSGNIYLCVVHFTSFYLHLICKSKVLRNNLLTEGTVELSSK